MDEFFKRISIIGVGLLGGAIGYSIKQKTNNTKVIGIGRNEEKLKKTLGIAIDEYALDFGEGVKNSDLIIICTPVNMIAEIYKKIKPFIKEEAIITDVGSTKETIIKKIQEAGGSEQFIGSHPMAGSEKSGFCEELGNIFVGKTVIITPTVNNPCEKITKLREFWEYLGSEIITLDAEEHDRITSLTSHLPHLISFTLSLTLQKDEVAKNKFYNIYGNGLLDMTRISMSDESVWIDIFKSNKKKLLKSLIFFKKQLSYIEDTLINGKDSELKEILKEQKTFIKQIFNK